MSNDVYTTINFESDEWYMFIEDLINRKGSFRSSTKYDEWKFFEVIFPEYRWKDGDPVGEDFCEIMGSKWINFHEVSEGQFEIHSAWCSPAGLIERLHHMFGDSISLQIEDIDSGLVGRVERNVEESSWKGRCLHSGFYDRYLDSVRKTSSEMNEFLEDENYRDDNVMDRYIFPDYIREIEFNCLDELVYEMSCFTDSSKMWKWDLEQIEEFILEGFNPTDHKEIVDEFFVSDGS